MCTAACDKLRDADRNTREFSDGHVRTPAADILSENEIDPGTVWKRCVYDRFVVRNRTQRLFTEHDDQLVHSKESVIDIDVCIVPKTLWTMKTLPFPAIEISSMLLSRIRGSIGPENSLSLMKW